MKGRSPFRILLGLFLNRFFEDESVAPGSGFATNIYQVLGFLVAVGFFVAYLTMPAFLELSFQKHITLPVALRLRGFRLFFPALTFSMIGFATVFEWDTLFPDRRDFLVLTQFPVPLSQVLAAKFGALGLFLGLLIGALNVFPTAAAMLFSLAKAQDWAFGARLVAAQILAAAGAALLAFLLVVVLQGILINISSPRIFLRISPWVQMIGMGLMVLAILTFPIYVGRAVAMREPWLWWFPPIWLTGSYDLLFPGGDLFYASLGRHAIEMSASGLALFAGTWATGFRRYYRRTLETEDTSGRRLAKERLRRIAASPEEWAMFSFCRKTLARSTKHRLFLATWGSAGLAIGLVIAVAVTREGYVEWSSGGARAFPFLMAFFVISGFRTVFQFPADLACNWLMQMTESRWSEKARRVTRKIAVVCGLIPLSLALWMVEWYAAGIANGTMHFLIQLTVGAVLIELTFWTFGKLPFTCSYFAGKTSLSLLLFLYLYGLSTYSFNMADLEQALEGHAVWAMAFLALVACALVLLWQREGESTEVIFDGSEPVIQTLDLN